MGGLIALAAGLAGFVFCFRPSGEATPRRWGLLALSLAVYLLIVGAAFAAMVLRAMPDRALWAYVVASLATVCAVLGAVAAGRKGAERWLLVSWVVPLVVAFGVAFAGQ